MRTILKEILRVKGVISENFFSLSGKAISSKVRTLGTFSQKESISVRLCFRFALVRFRKNPHEDFCKPTRGFLPIHSRTSANPHEDFGKSTRGFLQIHRRIFVNPHENLGKFTRGWIIYSTLMSCAKDGVPRLRLTVGKKAQTAHRPGLSALS